MPLFLTLLTLFFDVHVNVVLPIQSHELHLTEIGQFGRWRKDRPNIPGHFHTGIDIKRPSANYVDEPILSIADGTVVSQRSDGPYAQLIIEHDHKNQKLWTVYEHIAGIKTTLGQRVFTGQPIARYFNRQELDRHGWQFDHFHFEILKKEPIQLRPDSTHPQRRYQSFTLQCFTEQQLNHHFYDPIEWLMH